MENKHSVYGPSSAERWLNCSGSIQAEAEIPELTESEFATEGSTAHHLGEICLRENKKTNSFKDCLFHEFPNNPVDQEMVDCVQEYVDYVKSLGGQQEYEQKVSYEEWIPGGFGTADTIVTIGYTLHVIDLKYGKGIKKDSEKNPQGLLYALGALSERDAFQNFSKVIITIHQPRLNHVSSWETTPDYIYKWADQAKIQAKLCTAKNPERTPGESQCRWCRAKPICPALAVRTENALMKQFNELEAVNPTPPTKLRDVDLRFILNNKSMIIDWLKSVEAHVKDRVLNGEGFDGFKIVHGRSTRKWSDEDAAEKKLKRLLGAANAYTKKVLSPAQAEKALGKEKKNKIATLIVKPEGAPTLVSSTDNREAISTVSAADFN